MGRGFIGGSNFGFMEPPRGEEEQSFREFSAAELYCPKCKRAMAVRPKLLLVLSDGDLIDYCCSKCGSSLGTRRG